MINLIKNFIYELVKPKKSENCFGVDTQKEMNFGGLKPGQDRFLIKLPQENSEQNRPRKKDEYYAFNSVEIINDLERYSLTSVLESIDKLAKKGDESAKITIRDFVLSSSILDGIDKQRLKLGKIIDPRYGDKYACAYFSNHCADRCVRMLPTSPDRLFIDTRYKGDVIPIMEIINTEVKIHEKVIHVENCYQRLVKKQYKN